MGLWYFRDSLVAISYTIRTSVSYGSYPPSTMAPLGNLNRREFLGTATAAAGIVPTIIPAIARGGKGSVAPSDKINVGLVGCGTMAIKILMSEWLADENLHFVAVADPNRSSTDYRDWSPHGMRDNVRRCLNDDSWGAKDGILAFSFLPLGLVTSAIIGRVKTSLSFIGLTSSWVFMTRSSG